MVPKVATLNDLERHNGCYFALFCVILPHSVVLGANYVKMVEDRPILSAEVSENECLNERHPLVKGDNLTAGER